MLLGNNYWCKIFIGLNLKKN